VQLRWVRAEATLADRNKTLGPWRVEAYRTDVLKKADIAISMDGRGAWRDSVFVERLWRTIKYEEVCLRAYDSAWEARASIGRYLAFYNAGRPHSSLDQQTPDEAHFNQRQRIPAAA
jgi:putative transposase